MKRNAIARIIFYSITIVILLAVLFAFFGIRTYKSVHTVSSSASEIIADSGIDFSAEEINALEIHWVVGEITIQPTDSDRISISETVGKGKEPMIISHDGSSLTVEFCKNINKLKLPEEKNLVVSVPKDWYCQKLNIDAASSELTIDELSARDVNVSAASGECEFKNCSFENVTFDSASGELTYTGKSKKMEINAAAADASIEVYNKPDSIEMNSMSGKMDLTLPADCGFELEHESLAGDMKCDFQTTSSDGKYVFEDGHCKIEMTGLSASLAVHKGIDTALEWE